MKKFISAICIALLAFVPVTFAVDQEKGITKNGVSQGNLVTILKTHETLLNELATDHDADNATVAELVTDHDADNNILNDYETLLEELAADHDADNDVLAELVTDHDADNGIIDAHETMVEELAADHDADNDVIDDLKTVANAYVARYNESVIQDGDIAVSGTAEEFQTTATIYAVLKGFSITKAAEDNLAFTAADTINTAPNNGDFWGAWKVEMGLDGTVYTNSVSSDQAYADEAAAIAALPATTANRVYIGYITVEAKTDVDWVANTDDLTAASDCQAVNFYDVTEVGQQTAVSSSPAADLTAGTTVSTVAADLASSTIAADLTASFALSTVAADLTASTVAADLAAGTTLSTVAADLTSSTVAADLAAGTTVSTVAVDLTASSSAADLTADSTVGSGTTADPSISLTD